MKRSRFTKLAILAFSVMGVIAAISILAAYFVLKQANDGPPASPAVSKAGFEAGQPVEVEVIPPDREFRVETQGYYPGKDTLIGTNSIGKGDPKLYLVSDHGEVKRAWKITNKFGAMIGDRRILPNGHIMFVIGMDGIYEIDYDGNLVWHYFDKTVTHHAELLPNGNVLTAGVPCDCVKEIDYETKQVAWEWNAGSLFPEYTTENSFIGSTSYPDQKSAYAEYRIQSEVFPQDWTHINYVQWLPETDTFMVSLRSFDLIVEVNRAGEVIWSFGPGVIKHQHYPRVLPDNTILVFDNGNGRVIRINRSHEILWEYRGLYAPFLGDNNLLEDGNYKILQTIAYEENGGSDLRIVSPDHRVLWRLVISGPNSNIYRADMAEPVEVHAQSSTAPADLG